MGLVLARPAAIICAALTLAYGQQLVSREQVSTLRALSVELHQRQLADRQQVVRLAEAAGIPVRQTLPDGRTTELQRFADGRPLYYITTNLNAARTVSTDLVWQGGQTGLNLTGTGVTAGLWDEGHILTTHQEFVGRVSLADSSTSSNHATHVAGTMIAYGIKPEARGMAGEAELRSYDWKADDAEMAAAAADGLILSNHSYSYIVGWQLGYEPDRPNDWYWFGDPNISATEDYLFGFYDTTAYNWDQIASAAPYYLIIAAAGNDRDNTGPEPGSEHWVWNGSWWVPSDEVRLPDGDYDCLPGGPQVAKNVLVVGAVDDIPEGYTGQDDVVTTSFSSWGPTDDGRIKPDLVANGLEVYSTDASSDSAYSYLSGTSMAAPNVAGSAALLQQHYWQTHNSCLPLATTLRALMIHTADEAGTTPGPDYSCGWGLLNTAAAADVISRDASDQWVIQERTLNEDEIYSFVTTSDGTDTLKVTIAWADPPSIPLAPVVDDTTARLVNDLDLRINYNGIELYYPWVLDGLSPESAATQADNSVDNVEQILVPDPAPGQYTITVSHKNTLLAGVQNFSMVVTGGVPLELPSVLVWEGDSAGTDYSGVFIRDELQAVGDVEVTYATTFPEALSAFDAAFLSFGPPGPLANRTCLDSAMAATIQAYLEEGGSVYLEGGDAFGVDLDQADNDTLLTLLGIESAFDGDDLPNPIDGLEGQPAALTNGMSFLHSDQVNTVYIDTFVVGGGTVAFIESNYGVVAVQNTGSYGQRTFTFSYALAGLVDGDPPSTRVHLLAALLDFLLEEPPLPPNNAPLACNDTATTTEDSAVTIQVLANDYDPDNDQLVLTSVTQGIHGAVEINCGGTCVVYTPDADFFGSDSFTYELSDGNGGLGTGMVDVTVTPVNDAPESFIIFTPANDTTLTIMSEDLSDTLTLHWQSTNDADGDSVWYHLDVTGALAAIIPHNDTSATRLKLTNSDLVSLMQGIGESIVAGTWAVMATDGVDTTWATNGPFELILDISKLGTNSSDNAPEEFALWQNYPNPFNPSTTIVFTLPRAVDVRLDVVDLLGRQVTQLVTGPLPAGYYQITWDGRTHLGIDAPSGIYILRMVAPGFTRQIKMLLLR